MFNFKQTELSNMLFDRLRGWRSLSRGRWPDPGFCRNDST